jgi:hypothetical protein
MLCAGVVAGAILATGGLYGVYDNLANNQASPLVSGQKAYAHTAEISSVTFKWLASDLSDTSPWSQGIRKTGAFLSVPADMGMYAGAVIGNGGVIATKYTYKNAVVPLCQKIGKMIDEREAAEKAKSEPAQPQPSLPSTAPSQPNV